MECHDCGPTSFLESSEYLGFLGSCFLGPGVLLLSLGFCLCSQWTVFFKNHTDFAKDSASKCVRHLVEVTCLSVKVAEVSSALSYAPSAVLCLYCFFLISVSVKGPLGKNRDSSGSPGLWPLESPMDLSRRSTVTGSCAEAPHREGSGRGGQAVPADKSGRDAVS